MRPNVSLTAWQRHTVRSLNSPNQEMKVPCNGCTACCRSPNYPPELSPEEIERFPEAEINSESGFLSLPRKEDGSCSKLIDGKCSIYPDRPMNCKKFDCRVYLAANACPDDPIMMEAVEEWEFFKLPTREDKITYLAMRLALIHHGKPTDLMDAMRAVGNWRKFYETAKEAIDNPTLAMAISMHEWPA
jgi:Fe-S-cluster containining protein